MSLKLLNISSLQRASYELTENHAIFHSCAAVAQLDRVLGYEPRGRGFDSCQPHHKNQRVSSHKELTRFDLCRRFVFQLPFGCRTTPAAGQSQVLPRLGASPNSGMR